MKFPVEDIAQLSNNQLIVIAHKLTAIPSMIILFVSMSFFFLIFGLLLVKNSRGRLFLILTLTFLFSGLVLLGLIFLPLQIQNFVDFLYTFIN